MAKTKYAKGDKIRHFSTYGYVQEYLGNSEYRVLLVTTYYTNQEHSVRSTVYKTGVIDPVDDHEFETRLKSQLVLRTPIMRLLQDYKSGYMGVEVTVRKISREINYNRKALSDTLYMLDKSSIATVPTFEELCELPVTTTWRNISDLQNDRQGRAA